MFQVKHVKVKVGIQAKCLEMCLNSKHHFYSAFILAKLIKTELKPLHTINILVILCNICMQCYTHVGVQNLNLIILIIRDLGIHET